jgi:hypothetical protein
MKMVKKRKSWYGKLELISEMMRYSKLRRISVEGLDPFVVDLKMAFAI